MKPARRPHRQPVLPQRLTSLRPLIMPYAEVGVERRQDGVRHFALHTGDYASAGPGIDRGMKGPTYCTGYYPSPPAVLPIPAIVPLTLSQNEIADLCALCQLKANLLHQTCVWPKMHQPVESARCGEARNNVKPSLTQYFGMRLTSFNISSQDVELADST